MAIAGWHRQGNRRAPVRVAVTGGSGFIGAHLVAALAARGERVRCLLRPASDRSLLPAQVEPVVAADLSDGAALKRLVRDTRCRGAPRRADPVVDAAGAVSRQPRRHRCAVRGTGPGASRGGTAHPGQQPGGGGPVPPRAGRGARRIRPPRLPPTAAASWPPSGSATAIPGCRSPSSARRRCTVPGIATSSPTSVWCERGVRLGVGAFRPPQLGVRRQPGGCAAAGAGTAAARRPARLPCRRSRRW